MPFANASISDIMATTIEHRSKKIADNVTANNALLKRLSDKGRKKKVSGGTYIMEELSFAENTNAGFYSGYDILPTGISDVISAAQYDWKQAAVPVVISGLEMLQNSGKERMIDLLESRLQVAENTMANLISNSLYSDGTGAGGKEIDGLDAMIPIDPTAAPYGGIDGAAFPFWQNAVSDQTAVDGLDPTKIQGYWNLLWSQLVRGSDRPDLILTDGTVWNAYINSLQSNQRFTNTNSADAGFTSVKFMDCDVVLDGGIQQSAHGTGAPTGTAYFLNTDYLKFKVHKQRDMVSLSPTKRYAVNQDAETQIIGFAGNLCCSGRMFQGRYDAVGV